MKPSSAELRSSARSTPLDNRLPPPIVAVVTGLLMGAVQGTGLDLPVPAPIRIGAIIAALLVAGLFGARAFVAFADAKTTINPVDIESASSLVTTGVYRISRNPMYVGLTALLVALAFALSNAWLLAGPALFVLFITRFQIMPEERAMTAKFGADYAAYRRKVRRWL